MYYPSPEEHPSHLLKDSESSLIISVCAEDTETCMYNQEGYSFGNGALEAHQNTRKAISYMDAIDKEKLKLEKSMEKSAAEVREWKLRSHELEDLLDEVEHIADQHHRFSIILSRNCVTSTVVLLCQLYS